VGAAAGHRVVDEQNDDCADYGDQDAVKIHASHAHVAKGVEEPSAQNSPKIPNTMSIKTPLPDLLTILLAMKPEISPRTVHVKNDIESCPPEKSQGRLIWGGPSVW
jgi:hypothetical protein